MNRSLLKGSLRIGKFKKSQQLGRWESSGLTIYPIMLKGTKVDKRRIAYMEGLQKLQIPIT